MITKTEIEKARELQAKGVMPLIGGLLDAYDGMSNDAKGTLRDEAPSLCDYLEKIEEAMCVDLADAVSSHQRVTEK